MQTIDSFHLHIRHSIIWLFVPTNQSCTSMIMFNYCSGCVIVYIYKVGKLKIMVLASLEISHNIIVINDQWSKYWEQCRLYAHTLLNTNVESIGMNIFRGDHDKSMRNNDARMKASCFGIGHFQ